jgi:glycosyltransferase involved in cell wall biosynthesis
MRIGIATVYSPGVRGGAELHAQGLADALHAAGHLIHMVRLPFAYWPSSEVGRSMEIWESQDFTPYGGGQIDLMICLKFPAYLLSHPNRAIWLLHQHRPAYELFDTDAGFASTPEDLDLRERIIRADNESLGSGVPLFTNSRRVSERLLHCNGIASAPLYHPPFGAQDFSCQEPLPYIFYPSRLEGLKRQHLLIEAIAACPSPVGAVISGDGGSRQGLERLVEKLDVHDRVRLVGHIDRGEMLEFYANCLGVFFGPYDEDYGYVTLEAMLSSKPVITCTDSGGPLEFVRHNETGFIVAPEPQSIAQAIGLLAADSARAREMGLAGRAAYDLSGISWMHVVSTLTRGQIAP